MPNLPFSLDKAFDGLAKVTLRGGVVGKVTFAVGFVAFALASIAWGAKNVWISAGAVVAIFGIAFTMLWRLINFADRNPQAALLEGAEFLVHEQMAHAAKGINVIPINQVQQVEAESAPGIATDPALAQLPDVEVDTAFREQSTVENGVRS